MASRALVASLGAILLGKSLEGTLAEKYGVRLAESHALGAFRRAGLIPLSATNWLSGIRRSPATGVLDRLEETARAERDFGRRADYHALNGPAGPIGRHARTGPRRRSRYHRCLRDADRDRSDVLTLAARANLLADCSGVVPLG